MKMECIDLRGLSFRTSVGEIVRLHDCICWRHLEGRPCRTAQDRVIAQSIDVVIIPVIPSGYGNSKRARKGAATVTVALTSPGDLSSNSSSNTAVARPCDGCDNVERDALLRCCAAARAALEAGGLRAAVDDCPRQTPGAKYHAWENRGVALRVEIGAREAASSTTCLALHPRLAHILPLAARAAAEPKPAERPVASAGSDGGAAAAAATVRTAAPGSSDGGGGRVSLRLGGLSTEALVAACRAVVATQAQDTASASGSGTEATGPPAAAAQSSSWCGKLHLWPETVAAWSSTQSAVIAMLAELAAAAGAEATRIAECTAAAAVVHAAASAGRAVGSSGQGVVAPAGPRPCVAHLRHLLQLGRPCSCGRGHYSLQQLKQEVERCVREGSSSSSSSSGAWPRQQQQEGREETEKMVMSWLSPALHCQLKVGQQQQQQQQQEDRQGRCAEVEAAEAEERQEKAAAGGAGGRGSGDSDNGGRRDGGEGSWEDRVVLLVGNIPSAVKAAAVQAALGAAFASFGCCGVAVSRTRSGGSHGWARVALGGTSPEAAAAAALAALNGRLRLGGAPLTVSYSRGRLDTIFPYLPYAVRAALHVDSTAAFSTTDQATADKMTDLLAGLAERLLLPPPSHPPSHPPSPSPPSPPLPPRQRQARDAVLPPPPLLLPLVLTDGTACCGGNALSFARRFVRVVAVELDPDRAEDLRHNTALVRAWDAFRHAQAAANTVAAVASSFAVMAHPVAIPPGPPPALPSHRGPRPQPLPPPQYPTGANSDDGAAGADSGVAAVAAVGLPTDLASLGSLEVLCGDYTRLAWSLRQDVVFMDPPWGGPQYSGSSGSAVRRPRSRGGEVVTEYGDSAFMLGQKPLSLMVSELLVSGGAGMVALKLPSRADAELRAMQARVRQLVAARLSEKAGSCSGYCGSGAGGVTAATANADRRRAGRTRLLGAEVTLGRSALVIFLLLPYRSTAGTIGEIREGPAYESVLGSGRPSFGRDEGASGGACGTWPSSDDDIEDMLPFGGAGAGGQSGGEESNHELEGRGEDRDDDNTDGKGSDDDSVVSKSGGSSSEDEEGDEGSGGGGSRGGRARLPGSLSRGAAPRDSRPDCARLGAAFRTALRHLCSQLGLPYRVVCE